MRNWLIIILLLVYSVNAHGMSREDSIRAYYNAVLEAEHYCIHKDYKEAVKLYGKAFQYKKPFATDVFNLMLCALDMKDNTIVLNCAERLIKKGAPLTFFEQSLFTLFKTSEQYLQLQAKYEEWHKEYLASTNQPLIEYIRKLVALDQNVHCMLPVKHEDTAFVNSMHNNDDSLAVILISLLEKNNYLDEDVVGAAFINDTVLKREPMYGIIALHEVQRGGKILTDAINDAMKKGHLRSEIGLGWLSQTMMTKLNLTRRYHVYNDTLWRSRETEQETLMFEQLSGQTNDVKYAILHDIYLDGAHFSVEERVIYNFFSFCDECQQGIDKLFFILPRSRMTGSVKEGHEGEFSKFIHQSFEMLAHK